MNEIDVRDKATALEMERKFFEDSDSGMWNLDEDGYHLIIEKYDKKNDSRIKPTVDAKLIEQLAYTIDGEIINISANFNFLEVEAIFEDKSRYIIASASVKEYPEYVLDEIIFFEEYSCCFESVEIEPGLKTYLEELLERTEEEDE